MGLTMKDLKAWLKTSAIEIRIRKSMHKQYQRDGYERSSFHYEPNGKSYWRVPTTGKDAKEFFDNMSALWNLRRDYRHKHIAYSELRGKTREQIEASYPYEGQPECLKPDEKRIQSVKDEVIETMQSACSQVD